MRNQLFRLLFLLSVKSQNKPYAYNKAQMIRYKMVKQMITFHHYESPERSWLKIQ